MINEELILAMSDLLDAKLDAKFKAELQPIKDDIRDIKEDVRVLSNKVSELDNKVSELDDRVSNLESDVRGIKLHLENVTDKNIQFLAENYLPAAKRYEQSLIEMDEMKADVDNLKKVVTEHSEKLQRLA